MAHKIKIVLSAVDPVTKKVIKQKLVYDTYVAECFAADFHMGAATREANIYLDDTLYYGYDPPGEPSALQASRGEAAVA